MQGQGQDKDQAYTRTRTRTRINMTVADHLKVKTCPSLSLKRQFWLLLSNGVSVHRDVSQNIGPIGSLFPGHYCLSVNTMPESAVHSEARSFPSDSGTVRIYMLVNLRRRRRRISQAQGKVSMPGCITHNMLITQL